MARRRPERSSTSRKDKYMDLVRHAVYDMEQGKGVSRQKIVSYVISACGKDQKNVVNAVKLAIIKALDNGLLVRITGSGLNGSFRLPGAETVNDPLTSFTSTSEVHINETLRRRSPRLSCKTTDVITFNRCNSTYNEHLHLKGLLKTPRSYRSSGFRVKFSGKGPKIRWISPRAKRRRAKRCA